MTGYWKTNRIITFGLFHFTGPADSYSHTLPMHCCIDRPSWSVRFSKASFADHVKSCLRQWGPWSAHKWMAWEMLLCWDLRLEQSTFSVSFLEKTKGKVGYGEPENKQMKVILCLILSYTDMWQHVSVVYRHKLLMYYLSTWFWMTSIIHLL